MIDLEYLYFEWLLLQLDPRGIRDDLVYICDLLHNCPFERRVGNDLNRAVDGSNLRKEFLLEFEETDFDPRVTNDLMMQECTWFEMLVALSRALDFLYEGGVEGRFIELITNMSLGNLIKIEPDESGQVREFDQDLVDLITSDIDNNRFDRDGHGGLFPLSKPGHPDQRKVEIWDQHSAYFNEKYEGVLWTSTK